MRTDEEARQQERAQYIKELEAELKDIREANVGDAPDGFLRHIYKTYPPKNPEHKLNDKDVGEWTKSKKILLTAIFHYHPDKQDKEKHGKKWAVLCEEITKLLNRRYETCKFPPEATNEETENKDSEAQESDNEDEESEETENQESEAEESDNEEFEDDDYEPDESDNEDSEDEETEYQETETTDTEIKESEAEESDNEEFEDDDFEDEESENEDFEAKESKK